MIALFCWRSARATCAHSALLGAIRIHGERDNVSDLVRKRYWQHGRWLTQNSDVLLAWRCAFNTVPWTTSSRRDHFRQFRPRFRTTFSRFSTTLLRSFSPQTGGCRYTLLEGRGVQNSTLWLRWRGNEGVNNTACCSRGHSRCFFCVVITLRTDERAASISLRSTTLRSGCCDTASNLARCNIDVPPCNSL